MLSNSLHRVVQHYIFVLEQLHVASEFEDGSIRGLLWRQNQPLDPLLDFPFCYLGITGQHRAEIRGFLPQEFSYLLVGEDGQLGFGF